MRVRIGSAAQADVGALRQSTLAEAVQHSGELPVGAAPRLRALPSLPTPALVYTSSSLGFYGVKEPSSSFISPGLSPLGIEDMMGLGSVPCSTMSWTHSLPETK